MLRLEVIGIACVFLLAFTGAVVAVIKLTERENKKTEANFLQPVLAIKRVKRILEKPKGYLQPLGLFLSED